MGCMKCGKKLGTSQVFCDECLKKMAQAPVKPGTLIQLPSRAPAPPKKKKVAKLRYWWNVEDEIAPLRSKVRWLTFALIVAIIGFLIAVAVIFLLLQWHGTLELFPGF